MLLMTKAAATLALLVAALTTPANAWQGQRAPIRAAAAAPSDGTGRKHFIRTIVEKDLQTGKHGGKLLTRFPPEPNGYLHVGHAKSICLNFGLASEYSGGQTNMRFDDTNPVKEDLEYVHAILDDVRWLVGDLVDREEPWSGPVRHSSDYFELFYECAVELIKQGKAYVDSLTADEIREYRGTLTTPGRDSPDRTRSIDENLQLFEDMKAGRVDEGALILRAKIDMQSPNLNMRDPALYRVRKAPHQMTGDAWCIYPMYDFAHCISDAREGITHSLCTLEFEDHRPLYDWILDQLQPAGLVDCHPQQIEFSRLNLQYTVLSKRKLIQLVQEKHVDGWDDPRMPTICGLRRRGYPPGALRLFCERVGISKADNNIDMSVLEDCARASLEADAPRGFAVLDPVKVTVSNWDGDEEIFEVPAHPKRPELGNRRVPFGKHLYIDREDFRETPERGFKRLVPGGQVRLRFAYVLTCDRVVKEDGVVTELVCSYDPDTRAGATPPGTKKVKGIIQWLSADAAVPAQVRLYDRLFTTASPGADQPDGDFLQDLNPASVKILDGCFVEPFIRDACAEAAEGDDASGDPTGMTPTPRPHFQFERVGYFVEDSALSTPGALVFNRVAGLRDTWATSSKTAAPGAAGSSGTPPAADNDGNTGEVDPRYPYALDPKAQVGVDDARRVELRVGAVLAASQHPDADGLFVQEIDVGDAAGPRTVVSGLAGHVPLDSLPGRRVVVVCNLKPAKMRGIVSDGMVLAASRDEVVELVEAPAAAEVGERLTVEGLEPPQPDKLLKTDGQQKVWKRLSKLLASNGDLEATVDGQRILSSAGPCSVPTLKDARIG